MRLQALAGLESFAGCSRSTMSVGTLTLCDSLGIHSRSEAACLGEECCQLAVNTLCADLPSCRLPHRVWGNRHSYSYSTE
jgi:hypothetical protein